MFMRRGMRGGFVVTDRRLKDTDMDWVEVLLIRRRRCLGGRIGRLVVVVVG